MKTSKTLPLTSAGLLRVILGTIFRLAKGFGFLTLIALAAVWLMGKFSDSKPKYESATGGGLESEKFFHYANIAAAPVQWAIDGVMYAFGAAVLLLGALGYWLWDNQTIFWMLASVAFGSYLVHVAGQEWRLEVDPTYAELNGRGINNAICKGAHWRGGLVVIVVTFALWQAGFDFKWIGSLYDNSPQETYISVPYLDNQKYHQHHQVQKQMSTEEAMARACAATTQGCEGAR